VSKRTDIERSESVCNRCGKWFTYGIDRRTYQQVYLLNGRAAEPAKDCHLCRKHGLAHDAEQAKRTKVTNAALKKLTRTERAVLRPMIKHYEEWN